MPRTRSLFPVALSVQSASDALRIPRRVVAAAVAVGELEAFQGPGRRIRIPVESLVAWVRTWPRATTKQRSVPNGN